MAIFWPNRKSDRLYFASYLDSHVKRYRVEGNVNLQPLLEFKRANFSSEISSKRNHAIHHESSQTKDLRQWLEVADTPTAPQQLNSNRNGIPKRLVQSLKKLDACIDPLLRYIAGQNPADSKSNGTDGIA